MMWLCQVVVCVSAGYRHSAAVSEDGELYTWGEGDFGRLGKLQLTGHFWCFRVPTPKSIFTHWCRSMLRVIKNI